MPELGENETTTIHKSSEMQTERPHSSSGVRASKEFTHLFEDKKHSKFCQMIPDVRNKKKTYS